MQHLYRTLSRIGALLIVAVSGSARAEPIDDAKVSSPFNLSRTHGVCRNCRTAVSVGDVQFVSRNEAWGVGYRPPGETGAGDWTVIHTRDRGRTWTEIRWSYMHNEAPGVSFANRREGWVAVVDMSEAETRLMQTLDGGAHWRRLPLRDLFINRIQYLGRGVGFAHGYDIYAKQSYLYATNDYGRHWAKTLLPVKFSGGRFLFVDAQRGLVAGCLDRKISALQTSDGGVHWSETVFDTPAPTTATGNCDAEVDGLSLTNDGHASLLVNKHSFGLNDTQGFALAWQSSDAGKTWSKVFSASVMGPPDQFSLYLGPYKLANNTEIITRSGADNGDVLYSDSGGQRWLDTHVAGRISECSLYAGKLMCGGDGSDGFAVVTIGGTATQ